MAQIFPLPCRVGPEAAHRLTEALAVMIDQGRDLGPRDAQIRSLGLSIDTLVQALQSELEKFGLAEELGALMGRLERLAALARSYPDPNADGSANMEDASVR
jgi:hypothetical protein